MRSFKPATKVKSCKYCTDYKGNPKLIMLENLYLAKRMPDGSLKCHVCLEEEVKNMILNSKKRRRVI